MCALLPLRLEYILAFLCILGTVATRFFFVLFSQDTWKIDPAQEYRAAYHDEQAHLCGYSPESLLNGFREGMLGIIFLVCGILILV